MRILRIRLRPDPASPPALRAASDAVADRLRRTAPVRPGAAHGAAVSHVTVVHADRDQIDLVAFLRPGLASPSAAAYAEFEDRLAQDPALRGWVLPEPRRVGGAALLWHGDTEDPRSGGHL